MHAFATLLDRLSLEPRRLGKEALLVRYFQTVPDPDRGYALAALTGSLSFRNAKPAVLRALAAERMDEHLFALSYDFVGDLSETIALLWPAPNAGPGADNAAVSPALADVVTTLSGAGKADVPMQLSVWLDQLDETGRWALLKLVTGGLRVGVSARLAKAAVARLGALELAEIEEVWHGLTPPYDALFAWADGRSGRPVNLDPAPFRPVMLAHPLDEERDIELLAAEDFAVEWKWDGIRIQAAAGKSPEGDEVRRLYSRTGEDISKAFPDILEVLDFDACLDGELLVVKGGQVRPFADLQKRLNRKTAGAKLLKDYPAAIRAYDLLSLKGEDLRNLTFEARRARLEDFVAEIGQERLSLSPRVAVSSWAEMAHARANPQAFLDEKEAGAVEGLMLKHRTSAYVSGRPKGFWFKWKRDPYLIDAVLMYAQRGHGKRSSFYSDYTFGVWRSRPEEAGPHGDVQKLDELVPVGKAYFGFTDEELREIDRFVRTNTINRFGPVREVEHGRETGLVLEVAFEGLNRSRRHKSGLAMRFPRISRLRWDKPPAEADRIETLESLLPKDGKGQ